MTNLLRTRFSRRSLFGHKVSSLFALTLMPALLQACGTPDAEQAGTNQTAPGKGARRSSGDSKSSKRSRDSEYEESGDTGEVKSTLASNTPTQGTAQALPANNTATQQPSTQLTPSTTVNSRVTGAKPDSGFFARGAPTLSLAQISAGQQVAAKCEGGLHDLVIEPQHLQALAQGQTVTIKSSVHTHFANPTVHGHSVTYTPIMG
ncbi:MAG: hypothetical protein FJ146_06860 [Deltaproteobacteria bacterium]|nr:hypothetical protein [Deltaproteobacteria bacterium]